MTILDSYRVKAQDRGDNYACALMARDLMRGDPSVFKGGYTFGNALYAAIETFDMLDKPIAISLAAAELHRLLAEEAGLA